MTLRGRIASLYDEQVAEFLACPEFEDLEAGRAAPAAYDRFIANVVRAHLKASRLLGLLYALAPPAAADSRRQDLLEELHHPGLLRQFAAGAGLAERLPELEARATDDFRRAVSHPISLGSLRELGLAVLCEVVAFDYLLSRIADRVAAALAAHCSLSPRTLSWWTKHAEVDRQHAEQGPDEIETYVRFYEIGPEDAQAIVELTLRDNVFIKQYLGESRGVPA
jgi:hypothetical protein